MYRKAAFAFASSLLFYAGLCLGAAAQPVASSELDLRGDIFLQARDACSDAFGANTSDAICSPSSTLCCARKGQTFPGCKEYLGKGWCCTGSKPTDNCYVDQSSVCDEPNSVSCVQLSQDTSKACCPRLTSCASEFKASVERVRCNIQHADLINAAATSSQSTSSPSTSSPTTTPSTTPASAASSTATPEPQLPALSGGAIAGIVIGALVVLAAAAAALVFWRRGRRTQPAAGQVHGNNATEYYNNDPYKHNGQHGYNYPQEMVASTVHDASEVMGRTQHAPSELMGSYEYSPAQTDATRH